MNRLNQKSSVFKMWLLNFKRISFSNYFVRNGDMHQGFEKDAGFFFQNMLYLQCSCTSKLHFDVHQLVRNVKVRMYTVTNMKSHETLTSVHVFAIYKLYLYIFELSMTLIEGTLFNDG